MLSSINEVMSLLNSKETTMSKVLFLDFLSAFNMVLPNQIIKDLSTFINEPWLILSKTVVMTSQVG